MSQITSSLSKKSAKDIRTISFITIFLLITIAGLLYIKWWPYYHKTLAAAATHSIGSSILGDQTASSTPSWDSAWQYASAYFKSVWKAAVLGVLLGSLIQVLLPPQWLLKVLGKSSFSSTAIAGMASIPSMMCTCCAAPIAVGLRKKNVSVGAALAFWLGNPTINPATLIFMTFVLSWKFTVLRLVFGLILTFGVSYLANRFAKDAQPLDINQVVASVKQESGGSFLPRWLKGIGSMLLYVVPTYILSVLLLGAIRVWLFPNISDTASNSLIAVIIFALAGLLFVIPTAAEIPIIQAFMALGLGSGPAAALLITLPAVSLPSLLMVAKSFPKRVMAVVIASVSIIGILSGIVGMLFL